MTRTPEEQAQRNFRIVWFFAVPASVLLMVWIVSSAAGLWSVAR